MPAPHRLVDASGLACPLPVLALAKALRAEAPGGVIRLWATDPAAPADVQAFCRSTGHALLASGHEGPRFWADVQKSLSGG